MRGPGTIWPTVRRLTRDMDGDGTPDQWGFHSSWDYYLFDSVIHAWGGRILDSDFNVVVDSPEAIQGGPVSLWTLCCGSGRAADQRDVERHAGAF